MKIGVLTRRAGYNLGSTLQALAMSELMKSLGHEVEIIDYDEASAHLIWKIRPIVEHIEYKIPFFFKKKMAYLQHRITQERLFDAFERDYLPLSDKRISSSRGLQIKAKNYDYIVVGSDQIWSPQLFDSNYFGSFLPHKEIRKLIPYAPSIGVSNSASISAMYRDLVNRLSVLSCREKEGAKILSEISGKDVAVVLDPTLMVDKAYWIEISKNFTQIVPNEKYVLTYFLGNMIPQSTIDDIAAGHGAKIVNVSMFNRPNDVKADSHLRNIGPGQFLALVGNASHIITDSFHATIFSWIFEKDFSVFKRFNDNDKCSQNSRIYTLLEVLGKESHLCGVDYMDSAGCFDEQKRNSLSYLRNALVTV